MWEQYVPRSRSPKKKRFLNGNTPVTANQLVKALSNFQEDFVDFGTKDGYFEIEDIEERCDGRVMIQLRPSAR